MRTIGLTGGIGSGKSTVARILREFGAEVIDADQVGHEVYLPGTPGFDQVTAAFGKDIVGPDGRIDRKKLGTLVFKDRSALQRLNAIVHPLIAEAVAKQLAERRETANCPAIVVEAALLIDAGWHELVDEVWVVTASTDAVIGRVQAQRGLPPEEVAVRIKSQLTDAERYRYATTVIKNTGTLEDLRRRVRAAWESRRER